MAHFAKIENNVVTGVLSVKNEVITDNNQIEQESLGVEFLKNLTGWPEWKKTSYNTKGGVYCDSTTNMPLQDQSKAFRKNYAGIGYTYDETRDAFIPPKLINSWVLNENTCMWEAPVPYPTDGKIYVWNESSLTWELSTVYS
jgi:hypothetical protein